jgi:hypothetical protein
MDAAGCKRRRYLRAGAWLADLRRLVAAGLSDRATARELNRLFPGHHFTRRSVLYWRHRRCRARDEDQTPAQERRAEQLAYQHYEGWGHLLPRWNEDAPGRWVGVRVGNCILLDWDDQGAWTGGHELAPAEVRILSALRDHGPLTRPALAAHAGLAGKNPLRDWHGRQRLATLRRRGLVVRVGRAFGLAPAVTGVDENSE